MKKIVIISSAVFSLILGIAVPAYTQQDQKNEKQDQHKQQQEAKKQAKQDQQHAQQPQNQDKHQAQQQQKQNQDKRQQQVKQQKQDQGRQQEQRIQQMQNQDRQQQQARQQQQRQDQSRQEQQRVQQRQNQDRQQQAGQQQRSERDQERRHVEQSTWQEHRARNWNSDHRSWQQRGGYSGYRIPQDRYRGYFGPQHWFRISGRPFMVYGGYPRFQYEGYWITLLDPWPEYWSNDWYDNDDVYVDYRNDGYYMYNRRYPNVAVAISISM